MMNFSNKSIYEQFLGGARILVSMRVNLDFPSLSKPGISKQQEIMSKIGCKILFHEKMSGVKFF